MTNDNMLEAARIIDRLRAERINIDRLGKRLGDCDNIDDLNNAYDAMYDVITSLKIFEKNIK